MEKIKINENDIVIKLHNIKTHVGTKTFVLPGDKTLWAFRGPNKAGKTGLLKTILSLYRGETYGDSVITHGENEAYASIKNAPGPGGTTYTLNFEASKKKTKFEAINEETGEKINKVTEIRKLFNVSNMTVEELFYKAQTAKGKKEIIQLIKNIVRKIDPVKYNEIEKLEERVKPKTGDLYLNQSEANEKYKIIEYKAPSREPNHNLIKEEEYCKSGIKEVNERLVFIEDCNKSIDEANKALAEQDNLIERSKMKIENQQVILDTKKASIDAKKELIRKLEEEIEVLSEDSKQIQETIQKGNDYVKDLETNKVDYLEQIQELEEKIKEAELSDEENQIVEFAKHKLDEIEKEKEFVIEYENYKETRKKALREKQEAEENLKDARLKIKSLYSSIELPFDFQIEDDDILINGLTLDESNQSKAEMKIIATMIMIYHNDSPIICMGELNDFDDVSLNTLLKLLKDSGYKMVADEVVRKQQDIKVVVYEIDE